VSDRAFYAAMVFLVVGLVAFAIYLGSTHTVEVSFDVAGCFERGGFWSKGWCYTKEGQ
jgi:hypothetical protein